MSCTPGFSRRRCHFTSAGRRSPLGPRGIIVIQNSLKLGYCSLVVLNGLLREAPQRAVSSTFTFQRFQHFAQNRDVLFQIFDVPRRERVWARLHRAKHSREIGAVRARVQVPPGTTRRQVGQ